MIIAEFINRGKDIAAREDLCAGPGGAIFRAAAVVDKALINYNGRFGAMNNIHRGNSQK